MNKTSIEWCTHSANWLSGCTKVSPACTHCYAESMTARLARMPDAPTRYRAGVVEDGRWTGRISYDPEAMRAAFNGLLSKGRSVRRVFVNSMSDTFHADAPPASLVDLAENIRRVEQSRAAGREFPHVIMLLTKRPGAMLHWQRREFPAGLPSWVWVGVTVEDQWRADERVPVLLDVATAGVRYLSMEPLLGAVNLPFVPGRGGMTAWPCGLEQAPPVGRIHWVIAGGESGPKARPSHPAWFRSLRDQCADAGVPFHFKQWGEWAPGNDGPGADLYERDRSRIESGMFDYCDRFNGGGPNPFRQTVDRIGKHAAGRLLDGVAHDGVPHA